MEALDRITIFRQDRRADLGTGKIKLGPDYACIDLPEPVEGSLPDRDVRGYSVVASGGGSVRYTGGIVDVSVHDTARTPERRSEARPRNPTPSRDPGAESTAWGVRWLGPVATTTCSASYK